MTAPVPVTFADLDLTAIATFEGRLVVLVGPEGRLDRAGRRVNRLSRGALERLVGGAGFAGLKPGETAELAYPAGLAAEAVIAVNLPARADGLTMRKAGGAVAQRRGKGEVLVLAGPARRIEDFALGLMLRSYDFSAHKSAAEAPGGAVTIMSTRRAEAETATAAARAIAEGVFFTRDLVNEPANVLTTTEFARRLAELEELGVKVEVLDEARLEKLGMRALLAVGQGSPSPSKVVVMRWQGSRKKTPPLALVGKGVVFDTGGISIKPALGMEGMTMDMGGAGTVAGVLKALALRKSPAHVVGVVGLVENMPDGRAQRPGDVVRSMKGDTIEVINTDAEGRLVLADILWYAQQEFKPAAMIDLATLTGAIVVGLGHENAGVFANDDTLCNAFLRAAASEGEGAWRMPLSAAYDGQIESRIADVKNTGGRPAGSITAARFLARFVGEGVPWIHLDIAGVASLKKSGALAPKGASGWGVMALNRLVADRFEG